MPIKEKLKERFKTFFNEQLQINTCEPVVNTDLVKKNSTIQALGLAPDITRVIICAFFELNDQNTYTEDGIKKTLREFFSQSVERKCSFFWAAFSTKQYFVGVFSFNDQEDIFCVKLNEKEYKEKAVEFCKKMQNSFKNADELLNLVQNIFVDTKTDFKRHIEQYYEANQTLPALDELDDKYKKLINIDGSYHQFLKKNLKNDQYCVALKNLFWEKAKKIGDITENNISYKLPDYFSKNECKKLKIFPIPDVSNP